MSRKSRFNMKTMRLFLKIASFNPSNSVTRGENAWAGFPADFHRCRAIEILTRQPANALPSVVNSSFSQLLTHLFWYWAKSGGDKCLVDPAQKQSD